MGFRTHTYPITESPKLRGTLLLTVSFPKHLHLDRAILWPWSKALWAVLQKPSHLQRPGREAPTSSKKPTLLSSSLSYIMNTIWSSCLEALGEEKLLTWWLKNFPGKQESDNRSNHEHEDMQTASCSPDEIHNTWKTFLQGFFVCCYTEIKANFIDPERQWKRLCNCMVRNYR